MSKFKLGDEVAIIENDLMRQVVKLDTEELVIAVNASIYFHDKVNMFNALSKAAFQDASYYDNEFMSLAENQRVVESIINYCKTGI